MPARRKILGLLGASTLALAAGGGAFLTTRRPDAALAPWDAARAGLDDPRLDALAHAVLAPSPHNRQPWRIALTGDDRVVVYCDLDSRLPVTDPHDRQIVIGFGCFLETLAIAAAQRGLTAETTLFPEGAAAPDARLDERPVALVRLVPGAAPDPLFAAITDRRSNRQPYESKQIDRDALAALVVAAPGADLHAEVAPGKVAALRDLTWRAQRLEMRLPRAWRESVDLIRFGKAEIEASPDGIPLGGPLLESLHVAGLLTRDGMMDPAAFASRQGAAMMRDMFASTPAWLWIPGANDRAGQIAAGRAWTRAHLTATRLGLAMHPVSQALQEYPEMAALYRELHGLLDSGEGRRVHMLGRLGYAPRPAPAPRWPLETRLRPA